jgi:chemotaxis protein CheX
MINADFINPFSLAAVHILNVQANVKAECGKAFIKQNDSKMNGDISGVVGVVSDNYNGSIVISFPEKTFLKIMSNMLGEEYTVVTKEICDGVSEILNMIFGHAKTILNQKGFGIKTAIPSIIFGKQHNLATTNKNPVIIIPFKSDVGEFFMEICISE